MSIGRLVPDYLVGKRHRRGIRREILDRFGIAMR
jgi:hypothetical protein